MPLLPVSHQPQQQQADCLAACAMMVLNYYGIQAKYADLLKELKIQSFGTSFDQLMSLVGAYRVSVDVGEGDWGMVEANIQAGSPVIAAVDTAQLQSYWQDKTSHALVIVGLDEANVYVNDPELTEGPKMISRAEFELAWLEMDYLYGLITPR